MTTFDVPYSSKLHVYIYNSEWCICSADQWNQFLYYWWFYSRWLFHFVSFRQSYSPFSNPSWSNSHTMYVNRQLVLSCMKTHFLCFIEKLVTWPQKRVCRFHCSRGRFLCWQSIINKPVNKEQLELQKESKKPPPFKMVKVGLFLLVHMINTGYSKHAVLCILCRQRCDIVIWVEEASTGNRKGVSC